MRRARLVKLSRRQKEQFIPLYPDFVIEVASPSDELSNLREKMDECTNSGSGQAKHCAKSKAHGRYEV